jgi:heme A synthase
MLRSFARRAFPVVAWTFLVALGVQIFFAGVYVFVGPMTIQLHRNGAHVIGLLMFALIASAYIGRVERRDKRATLGILGLLVVQGMLVHVHQWFDMPFIAALHPVNAMLMTWAALSLARRSSVYRSSAPEPSHVRAPMAEPAAA